MNGISCGDGGDGVTGVSFPTYQEACDWCRETYNNEMFRSVLKCSFAYVVASLGVYWLAFDDFLGRTDSKHVVATVAVYFHPSRTKGSMTQSLIFVLISLGFSFTTTFVCRFILGFFFNRGGVEISYAIDLLTGSFSLGVIAFMKQKVNKPTFNTACSLASISIVACIIKEGSTNASEIPVDRVLGTLIVVLTGCTISVICCYVIWPVSAIDQLRKHLNDSFNIFSALLSITTSRFINGAKLTSKDIEYFTRLNKNILSLGAQLEEAKFELLAAGREEEWKVLVSLVSITKSLARHIQALRSSVEMQRLVLEEVSTNSHRSNNSSRSNSSSSSSSTTSRGSSILGDLTQSIENLSNIDITPNKSSVVAINSQEIFELFVYHLAPSMRSFVFTIKSILSEIPFEKDHNSEFIRTSTFQTSLERAKLLYQEKQAEAFRKIYSQDIFKNSNKDSDFLFKTDQEEVAACCGNFSSLLVEFAGGLRGFLELTEMYDEATKCRRSWKFLRISRYPEPEEDQYTRGNLAGSWSDASDTVGADEVENHEEDEEALTHHDEHVPHYPIVSRNSSQVYSNRRVESTLNAALLNFQSNYQSSSSTSTINRINDATPKNQAALLIKSRLSSLSYILWKNLRVLNRTDVQFGIRVGLGACFLSVFAFLPFSKQFFNEWRIEWAIVIYCIMMNKSVGGTTMTIKYRLIGTFLGCYGAYLIWWLTDGNAYFLCLGGFLLSIPSFYIIIYWKANNPFGRFILLAYNITALYSYSMTQQDAEDGLEGGDNPIIGDIAFHRFTAVTIGIIFSLSMATLFLPNSARSRLKKGLAILWLRMGVIWNSDPLDYIGDSGNRSLIGLKDQKGLHDLLRELETLLKQAPNEFRLKGEFPKDKYEKLLLSTSNILDSFLNMNLMIEVDTSLTTNEEYVLQYISCERQEVEHRIFLIFYMIASAMRLGFPVPSKPASTEHAKDRMLFKLNEVRNVNDVHLTLTNEDYVLLYSYILVTNRISLELDKMLILVKDLLGEINEEIFELV